MISLVAAIDKDGAIGDTSTKGIPWNCSVDLELFRRLTWGNDIIVGRKTWEELPDGVRKCEGRRWIVITHDPNHKPDGLHNEEMTWEQAEYMLRQYSKRSSRPRGFVIAGGRSIYEQALEAGIVDRAFITRLPIQSGGDVEWPGLPEEFECVRGTFQHTSVTRGPMNVSRIEQVRFEEWVPS